MSEENFFGFPASSPEALYDRLRPLRDQVNNQMKAPTDRLLRAKCQVIGLFVRMLLTTEEVEAKRERLPSSQPPAVLPDFIHAAKLILCGFENILQLIRHNLRAAELLYKLAETALAEPAGSDMFERNLARIEEIIALVRQEFSNIRLEQVEDLLTDFVCENNLD